MVQQALVEHADANEVDFVSLLSKACVSSFQADNRATVSGALAEHASPPEVLSVGLGPWAAGTDLSTLCKESPAESSAGAEPPKPPEAAEPPADPAAPQTPAEAGAHPKGVPYDVFALPCFNTSGATLCRAGHWGGHALHSFHELAAMPCSWALPLSRRLQNMSML